jgi:hypothetical protein
MKIRDGWFRVDTAETALLDCLPLSRADSFILGAKGSSGSKYVNCTEGADVPDPARSEEEPTPARVGDDERHSWAGCSGSRMQQLLADEPHGRDSSRCPGS